MNNPFSVYWYLINVIILVDESPVFSTWYLVNIIILVDESPVFFYLVTPILIEELDGLSLVDLFFGDSFILRLTWGKI